MGALQLLAFVALPLAAASPACSAHSACALLLLAGNCCPNDWGGYLDCCEKYPPGMASPPTPAASPPPTPPPPNPPPCTSPPPSPTAASTSLQAPPPPPAAPVGGLLGGEPLGSTDLGKFKKAGPHPQRPSAIWGVDFEAPVPTNRWWINLVLADGETVGENAVDTLPYVIKALADGLHVCLPAKEATPNFVTLLFEDTLTFGARELVRTSRSIRSHGDLSVNVAWTSGATLADGSMVVPLVRGMPYASAIYTKMTPQLTFGASPIKMLNGQPPDAAKAVTAARLQFDLANGQTWVLYANAPVDVTVDGPTVRFVKPYDGVLRAAIVTADTAGVLDAYASRVPTGCSVQVTALGDRATLSFAFEAQGEGELLTMALPHHLEEGHLGGVARTKLSFSTLKGEMIGVVGDTWQVYEALPALEWGAPRPIANEREDAVRAALAVDKEKVLGREAFPTPDPYGSGKEMAAAGRLALIADELGELATAAALRARLALKLEEWLSGAGPDALKYEPTYGGLVPTNGLLDRGADFGAGWYNDHHFHYGYFLYAAAAVGRKDPAWLHKWAPAISHLIRDIANPSRTDPLYPPQRFKDWYVGHSWASGLFPSASGRNQESVSEALNAWYGLALYGSALGDVRLRDLGRVMLATELRSGWKYWQIDKESTTYPAPYAQSGLATVVWSTKVDKSTWFGPNIEYAYGIQTMPVTPITELWLRPNWLRDTRSIWAPAMGTAAEEWRGILLMMSAINQPADAWRDALQLNRFDNGNTKTNVLYWIATRPPAGSAPSELPAFPPPPPCPHRRSQSRSVRAASQHLNPCHHLAKRP